MTSTKITTEQEQWLEIAKGFGLSAEEFSRLKECLSRTPTLEEIAVAGALWSEHCSYKSSRVHLARFHTQEPWVLQGPGENAGIIEVADGVGLAFKMESHNHPSYIEPYQGAATGVGGILRDVFCMGARPVANINCLRYGEGEYNAHLLKYTVRGIGDYGNSVGVPTVNGQTKFHAGYTKNILVNAFTAGLVRTDAIFRGKLNNDSHESVKQKPSGLHPGQTVSALAAAELFPAGANQIIYFGSATGRDGVHGATMSSDAFDDASATLKPTVQVGDPFAEKKLIEVTLELLDKKLCIGLQDMGAAGLTSSGVEMAGRSGCGVALNLNAIPARTARLKPYEYLLSESQERMLCAVTPENVQAVLDLCHKHSVACAVIGAVNNTGEFICTHNDSVVCALPVDVLTDNAPKYHWPLQDRTDYLNDHQKITNQSEKRTSTEDSAGSRKAVCLTLPDSTRAKWSQFFESSSELLNTHWNELLAHLGDWCALPSQASKDPLTSHYCSTVQSNTIAGCQTPRSASAAVIRLDEAFLSTKQAEVPGIALSAGCQERWIEIDPLHGASQSTLLLARKIAATGALPKAMTDCLNFGSPRQPAVMRQISDAIDGINAVATELKIPIVSGNVSLNNQTGSTPIPPTPMVGMVGLIKKHEQCVGDLPSLNSQLWWLRSNHFHKNASFQLSEWAWQIFHSNSGPVPVPDFKQETALWNTVFELRDSDCLASCSAVGNGGLLGTLINHANRLHAGIEWSPEAMQLTLHEVCSEGQAGMLISLTNNPVAKSIHDRFIQTQGLSLTPIGKIAQLDSLDEQQREHWQKAHTAYATSLTPFFE
jgi:phosphoribosylformylglycinamidine synthase subunit PurL